MKRIDIYFLIIAGILMFIAGLQFFLSNLDIYGIPILIGIIIIITIVIGKRMFDEIDRMELKAKDD